MYEIENKTKSLVTGNYSSFANCRTYIPRHLEEIWDFLRNIKICIYLFIYFTISRGTRIGVLRKPSVSRHPSWETLPYTTNWQFLSPRRDIIV